MPAQILKPPKVETEEESAPGAQQPGAGGKEAEKGKTPAKKPEPKMSVAAMAGMAGGAGAAGGAEGEEEAEQKLQPLFVSELVLEPELLRFNPSEEDLLGGMQEVERQFQLAVLSVKNLTPDTYFDAFTRCARDATHSREPRPEQHTTFTSSRYC